MNIFVVLVKSCQNLNIKIPLKIIVFKDCKVKLTCEPIRNLVEHFQALKR